jgi:GNAT superfamily N-acetyltransferase
MRVEISEEAPVDLAAYATVPIAFEVRGVLDVDAPDAGLGGLTLRYRPLARPYVKDYDAPPAGRPPTRWAEVVDLAGWGVLVARVGGERVGGAVVAPVAVAGESDAIASGAEATLWDIRVAPAWRGRGAVGAALFEAAEAWARARGATALLVETQTVNVPACRFYARRGCVLAAVDRFAYPTLPDEVRLMWRKSLAAPASG